MACYRRVTYADRCQIHAFLQVKLGVQEIARSLGVDRSTIFREISRNGGKDSYCSQRAELRAIREQKSRRRPFVVSGDVEGQVIGLLFSYLSPEQISNRLALEKVAHVSHQTIYNYIYRDGRSGLGVCLRRFNRRGASRMRMKAHKQEGKIRIDKRPKASNLRSRIGDWERDCMYAANQQRLLACVDRKSRYTKLERVSGNKVRDVTRLTNRLLRKTQRKAHTITNDNGPEFRHPTGNIAQVYYCHPRRPQQRGTVENTIGLVRQFIKRKTNLNTFTQSDIQLIEDNLNFRPRKCLDYRTPYEVFYRKTVALAL